MQCREVKELLSPYLDGVLDPQEGEGVAAHLAVCPDCRAQWHALCEAVDAFRSLPEVTPPPGFSARVIDRIKSPAAPAAGKKTAVARAAAVLGSLAGGRWSRVVALAATVVLTAGVTVLMHGAPGNWKNRLFLPQPSFIQTAVQEGAPAIDGAKQLDPSGGAGDGSGAGSGSGPAGQGVFEIADSRTPDGSGSAPDAAADGAPPPSGSAPGGVPAGDDAVRQNSSSGQTAKYFEQLNSLLEEQARGGGPLPSTGSPLAAPRTMAVKEGAISQQAAFGYIPVSSNESRKVIRSASFSLAAADPAVAPAELAGVAGSNGGYVLPGDPGSGVVTLKVPADRFNQAVKSIRKMGNVTLRQIGADDVTEKYYNYEARVKDLAAEEQRLLTVLDGTGPAAAAEVQVQLTRVRENLERQKKLLERLAGDVDLATIKVIME